MTDNPNIYTDFRPFKIDNDKYLISIRYKIKPDLSKQTKKEDVDGFSVYTSNSPSHFYFIKNAFYYLGSETY